MERSGGARGVMGRWTGDGSMGAISMPPITDHYFNTQSFDTENIINSLSKNNNNMIRLILLLFQCCRYIMDHKLGHDYDAILRTSADCVWI